jgi:hypothetical protein
MHQYHRQSNRHWELGPVHGSRVASTSHQKQTVLPLLSSKFQLFDAGYISPLASFCKLSIIGALPLG